MLGKGFELQSKSRSKPETLTPSIRSFKTPTTLELWGDKKNELFSKIQGGKSLVVPRR
jgi:hypothetical protein